ncbi:MAG: hypothetical protein QOH81_2530 [Sphingomonadales bacterium]|jgi:hypothetical protein|nr:hypothetical protein [Sphingomonadales bacterium]
MQDKKSPFRLPYKDIVGVAETYADSVESIVFHGNTLGVILTVSRFEEPKPPRPPSGARVPAVRLVMSANGFIELYNKLHQLVSGLAAQGILTMEGQEAKPTVQ